MDSGQKIAKSRYLKNGGWENRSNFPCNSESASFKIQMPKVGAKETWIGIDRFHYIPLGLSISEGVYW